jgi:hypothetical protein
MRRPSQVFVPLIVGVITALLFQSIAIANPTRAGDKLDCYLYPFAAGCRDTATKKVSHTTNSPKAKTIDLDYIKKHDPQLYARMRASTDQCTQMAQEHKQNTAQFRQQCGNNAPPPQQVTEYIVREQFQTLPLPRAALQHQPTWGALVNKKEIFYTTAARHHDYPLNLLGHRVVLHAIVTNYTWSWGDGTADTSTTTPGAPYPSFAVTHTYAKSGTCPVSVTLTYSATYSVDGGPAQQIEGTATIAGQPADVVVQSAHSVLVAGDH